ncbi:hypothetical protein AWB69_07984 [Caballeronia udeis]|uniref:Uncharacterized protein n=1 Tax=Caballeronia udeis TaxID=1232866 RepID=A0A158JHA9_9BURK|nr:hypothetical protein AWB69_07984 [Caballeronia udeis]
MVGYLTGERHFVCNNNHRSPFGGKIANYAKYLANEFGVQGRSRLVKQHYFRTHRKRSSDCRSLLLTSRQEGGIDVLLRIESDFVKQLLGALDRFSLWHLEYMNRGFNNIPQNRSMRPQIEALKYHAKLTADSL